IGGVGQRLPGNVDPRTRRLGQLDGLVEGIHQALVPGKKIVLREENSAQAELHALDLGLDIRRIFRRGVIPSVGGIAYRGVQVRSSERRILQSRAPQYSGNLRQTPS